MRASPTKIEDALAFLRCDERLHPMDGNAAAAADAADTDNGGVECLPLAHAVVDQLGPALHEAHGPMALLVRHCIVELAESAHVAVANPMQIRKVDRVRQPLRGIQRPGPLLRTVLQHGSSPFACDADLKDLVRKANKRLAQKPQKSGPAVRKHAQAAAAKGANIASSPSTPPSDAAEEGGAQKAVTAVEAARLEAALHMSAMPMRLAHLETVS